MVDGTHHDARNHNILIQNGEKNGMQSESRPFLMKKKKKKVEIQTDKRQKHNSRYQEGNEPGTNR